MCNTLQIAGMARGMCKKVWTTAKRQDLSERQRELVAAQNSCTAPKDVKGAVSSQVLNAVSRLRQQRHIDARERLALVYKQKHQVK